MKDFEMKLTPFPAKVRYHAFAVRRCDAFHVYTDINMFAWGIIMLIVCEEPCM
jgi:hypothetical protein